MPIDQPQSPTPARRSWAERERGCSRWLHRASARPSLTFVLIGVSRLSNGSIWVAILLSLPMLGGASGTACALRMGVLGAVDLLIYKIVKRHFARPRPFVACPGIRACTPSLDEHSFPSGHTLHAVAFATLLCAYYPSLAWWLWPFAGLVALSRVVLGLHYPSDVIVGAAIGGFIARSVLVLF